jgi:multisubunit Na+/H+ antiporter MnhG subunit
LDISRAFTFTFDDKQWVEKVVLIVVMTLLSAIPFLGLIATAALLGYSVQIIENMRNGEPNPLPRWDNIADLIARGGNVLVALIVYMLPNILIACCVATLPTFVGDNEFFGGGFAATILCCIGPLILIYNLIAWPMLALGMVRYSEIGKINVFFEFGDLFAGLQRNSNLTIQWIVFTFLANLVIGLFNIIPCIGWIVTLALTVPVHGHLLGQFALRLDDKPKRKLKRPSMPNI